MIVIVDDEEVGSVTLLAQELRRRGEDVVLILDVVKALAFFEKHQNDKLAIVLDLMMDPGTVFDMTTTQNGRKTGLAVLSRIRNLNVRWPVYIFTNLTSSSIPEALTRDGNAYVYIKTEILYDDLADEIVARLRRDR